MALKVHRVVVVGCPRCVLAGNPDRLGVGKSCFCNRFVRPDCFKLQHPSRISEDLWRESPAYNGDHFLYWGAATKRHADGSKTRFQVVEQTEFFDLEDGEKFTHRREGDYITRASATHFISRGKVAYRVYDEEEYSIPSSLKSNPKRSRATQLFPNNEFSEGKGVSGFICIFDPTLEGENIKIQFDFLTKLLNQISKTKRKIIVACTKCDEVNEARIQFGANLVASVRSKKPIPFIQTSAKEGINIDEAFNYIVGQYNMKKKHSQKGGKSSPIMLGLPYSELVKSRGKDESFARVNFNRMIKDKVNLFTAEWSTTWPYLQLDPKCLEAANVIGLTEAKKIFCQRLMELKVAEVKDKGKSFKPREKLKESQSRSYQNEILEAFSTHPDLINESAYEFVYTPSLPSIDTTTSNSSMSPSSPLQPSPISSSQPLTIPVSQSGSPPPQQVGFSPPSIVATPISDAPLPPVCTEPSQISQYRTATFSPTRTSLAVNSFASKQLNKSTELLNTLPRVEVGLQRHSSLRYKNRTLPPLPSSRPSDLFKVFAKQDDSESDESETGGAGQRDGSRPTLRRQLSNSMDCLKSSNTINDNYTDSTTDINIEASPYLRPIDVQSALAKRKEQKNLSSSMKIPSSRAYHPLPEGFLTIGRNGLPKSYDGRDTRDHVRSNPRLFDTPPVPPPPLASSLISGTKPRSSSSPPPPPPPPISILDNPKLAPQPKKPMLCKHEEETSLDDLGWLRGPPVCTLDDVVEDNMSDVSGPFTELEEPDCLPPLMSEIRKSHESISIMSPVTSGSGLGPPLDSPLLLVDDGGREMSAPLPDDDKTEGIYASIPSKPDEEYLTMKSGVSLDDLLSTKGVVTTPLPSAKSVIKKLQLFTHKSEVETLQVRRSESPVTPRASPGRSKKISNTSIQSVPVSRRSLEGMDISPLLQRGSHRSTMFNRRPLPQSPTKLRKVSSIGGRQLSTNRRKNSFNDSNIYETIDGEHTADWLKQLKEAKAAANQAALAIENEDMKQEHEQIMNHFLSLPQVQELWLSSVKTVYPDFNAPDSITSTVPPLLINPAYFASRNNSSVELVKVVDTDAVFEDDSKTSIEEPLLEEEDTSSAGVVPIAAPPPPPPTSYQSSPAIDIKHLQPPQHSGLTKKESFTDKVLAKLNQRLLLRDNDSSSEEDSDEETYSETSSDCDDDYLQEQIQRQLMSRSRRKVSIHEHFTPDNNFEDKLIVMDRSPRQLPKSNATPTTTVIPDSVPLMNGFDRNETLPWSTNQNPASVNNVHEDEESGTGSSSPTGTDMPLVNCVVHPAQAKNMNHLTVCQFNSMDSGISANGNTCIEEHAS